MKRLYYVLAFFLLTAFSVQASDFKVLVLTERGGLHEGFVVAALDWLEQYSKEKNFEYKVVNDAKNFTDDSLSQYQVFLQLNFPPYMWSKESEKAFIKYIEEGRGGWIGFHHAALLGEFDGYPMWQWFSTFLGDIVYKNYIAETVDGTVCVEDTEHPVMKGVNPVFTIENDEWYIFNKNPRPNVHVLAHVDEASYRPASDIKMGDHPVIWVNEQVKARNVYFLMGHHAKLLSNEDFKKMLGNAIMWTAGK